MQTNNEIYEQIAVAVLLQTPSRFAVEEHYRLQVVVSDGDLSSRRVSVIGRKRIGDKDVETHHLNLVNLCLDTGMVVCETRTYRSSEYARMVQLIVKATNVPFILLGEAMYSHYWKSNEQERQNIINAVIKPEVKSNER